jgi:hypothetical protein
MLNTSTKSLGFSPVRSGLWGIKFSLKHDIIIIIIIHHELGINRP